MLFSVCLTFFLFSFNAYSTPEGFRIRPNAKDISNAKLKSKQEKRSYRVKEAIEIKKLDGELEGMAVVVGLEIREIDSKYYDRLSKYVFEFIQTSLEQLEIELFTDEVIEIGKEHFLDCGEQAWLLALTRKALAAEKSSKVVTSINNFLKDIAFVIDTNSLEEL